MSEVLLPGFGFRLGAGSERYILLQFMQYTFEELYPGNNYHHLQEIIDQYWSDQTPFWLVSPQSDNQHFVGCLWLGTAIDQVTGEAYTHLFVVYVTPKYRRQGLGTALLRRAEQWAVQQGNPQIGLQVFAHAQAARSLYEKLGYAPRALLLMKSVKQPERDGML
ncbi:GNAT family N-acetyltransferase [Acaryochloris sp. IP29b_bin.137]|uniref:GNAT family N-acetyltransferase n=1 Tax=Acaryochloris sp. IP29b_bin.137 TaxID=2969217 RepID=UPI0026204333|nr:GNAT family N-acetyltransferase [Acaryochloris sp. IP29b_bin.137]